MMLKLAALRQGRRALHKRFQITALGVVLLSLAGCSSDGGEKIEPNPLPEFTAEVTIKKLWTRGVGDGQGENWLHLMPAIDGEAIYTVGSEGTVTAINRVSGKEVWETKLKRRIGGGVGAGEGLVLLATRDGYVLALNAENGELLWEMPVSSESLSPPQISRGVVVVQTIDGKLTGLDATTGERLWLQESLLPVLTLRGSSTPLLANGVAYAGFSNGEAKAFRLDTGAQLWNARVAIPRGASELERMVDIEAAPLLSGDILYMVSYQGNVAALDARSGYVQWARSASSYANISEGFGHIYLVDTDSTVSGLDQRTGTSVWSQKELQYRNLSATTVMDNELLMGDFEGYLHVLSQVDGRIVGRTKVNSSGIRVRPLVADDTAYVYTNNGKLVALQITDIPAK